MSVAVAKAKSDVSGVYEREDLLNGCQAVAQGVCLADVDVIAAYPIRPYTEVMDALSKLIADGKFDAEYIIADSEHSQFEIVKHASSVNARAFGGSSDTGWLLCWVTTPQEALEHVLIGYRIAEDKKVRMPMGLAMDGAFLTHSQHMVKIPSVEAAKRFLPQYDLAERRLHPDNPISVAPQANEDWVMEIRRQNWEAAKRARGVIKDAYKEFNEVFGERYAAPYYFDEFMTDDAEAVLIGIGTVVAPARTAVRRLREKGQKVGYVNLRWFRPFPTVELRDCLSRFKAVGVIDRDFAHGSPDNCGILMHEIRSCLYPAKNRPAIVNFMGGLGGRDLSIAEAQKMFETTQQAATKDSMDEFITWIGLRE